MTSTRARVLLALTAGGLLSAPLTAQLGVVSVTNEPAAFVSQTGAVGQGPWPALGGTVAPVTVGEVTASFAPPSVDLILQDWTPILPGTDLGVSGTENLDFTSAADMSAFGFEIVEPSTPGDAPGCNFPVCVDSTFTLQLFDDGTLVGETTFDVPDDVFWFVGVSCTLPFDRVELRELTDDVGNEYLGQLYVGRCRPSFNYGAGTAGSGGFTPDLPPPAGVVAAGQPDLELGASAMLGGAPVLLAVGLEPLDLTVKGIQLLVSTDLYLPLVASGPAGVAGAGTVTLPLTVDAGSPLIDTTVYVQFITLDDGGSAFGFAASQGLALTICPPL